MPIFFLTPDNCDFAKRAMRLRLTSVKSTHLTETLASASGFRTHAALLAAVGVSDARRPTLVSVEPSRLTARLQELGHPPHDAAAVLIETLRASEMPVGTWREYRSRDVAAINTWFRECKRRDIPNVYIQLRTKYAKVSWDCISVDPRDESHLREEAGSALGALMFKRYQELAKGDPAKSVFSGSAFVGSVDRLSPAVARDIADDFFMRLYIPMMQRAAA
jgi:hypothetical protein